MNKLEGNGRWETKMMLPEHREALLRQRRSWDTKQRPNLDEQELELLHKGIGDALFSKTIVTLTVFGDQEDRELTGYLTKMDPFEQTIRIRCVSGNVTVPLVDVLKVE